MSDNDPDYETHLQQLAEHMGETESLQERLQRENYFAQLIQSLELIFRNTPSHGILILIS